MTAIVINNGTTFGGLTNQSISRLIGLNTSLTRLQEAVATASSGYTGVPGTEFETGAGTTGTGAVNNFGIQPDPETPGKQGQAYSYALGQLQTAWAAFWGSASQYIEALDNGIPPF